MSQQRIGRENNGEVMNDMMNKGPNTKSVEKVLGVNLTDYY